jgi:hydroxymethylglutaryl-CoA lyase
VVNIVEVGPRDGLQNEKGGIVPVDVKVELIDRLVKAGVTNVEAGSFVSPKWVPQASCKDFSLSDPLLILFFKMAGTAEVLEKKMHVPDVHYACLVPNQRGLDDLLTLLSKHQQQPRLTDEISIFTAATDAFTRANLNCTTSESLTRLAPVTRKALDNGIRVRGYVSVVIACPYTGKVDYKRVREVAKELIEMGCYEVSLGDTVGQGTPFDVSEMIAEVVKDVPIAKLAGHVSFVTSFFLLCII